MPDEPAVRSLYRRWVVAFTLGELVGFGLIPVVLGVTVAALTRDVSAPIRPLLFYAVAVLGGLGEGSVLATFQLRVLRSVFPSLDPRKWRTHTGLAAAGAWAVGMAAPTLDDLFGLSPGQQIAIWVPSSVLILVSIGGVQARLLRPHAERPWRWLLANALGWLAGLPWTFVAPALVPDDASPVAFGVALAFGGIAMGVTAGAVTGRWLVRMVPG